MKYTFGGIVVVLLLIFGVGWAVQGNSFFMYKVFAPAEEEVRREVFEESQAYNHGVAQELQQLQLEYIKGTDSQKDAIGTMVLHKTAAYDVKKLPQSLQNFVNKVKSERGLN